MLTFLRELRVKLEDLKTSPGLMDLLLRGLEKVIKEEDPSEIPVHEDLQLLKDSQTSIGWHQLLRGRLSQQWQLAQDRFLGNNATERTNGQTWTTTVIDFIFTHWFKLWELRNGDRHGRDSQTRAQAKNAEAIRELEQLYDKQDRVGIELQWLFTMPLETRKQWNTPMIRIWIEAWGGLIEKSAKAEPPVPD